MSLTRCCVCRERDVIQPGEILCDTCLAWFQRAPVDTIQDAIRWAATRARGFERARDSMESPRWREGRREPEDETLPLFSEGPG